ncbi:plasmid pRiA4b ORF-3 family protein [Deinococcus sp. Arct2-2]|uniref:plasmid pRiA4b ORF-3 family protein n=1 Tax=Deinococcus sp. Arct2-2 TaxID=2568653 RepID=UPI0010A3D220|nr:plasmid pRiA4b ORF-3 family protein [Deinococcus sp. Arct2-2]THF68528.1 plasmid pRiA4b ORF-3 family protein [Deinococcus sp. Arct2-2]
MAAEVVIYQLNIVLREVEPTVWRRVLVRSDTSIALLHQVVQVALGWEDVHLHKFRIHGRDYGTSYEGGIMFSTNPQQVRLDGFKLRAGERFRYEYDFGDFWEHDLRLERVLPLDPKKKYPVCVAGQHSCPPEDCGGPEGHRQGVEELLSWEAMDDLRLLSEAVLRVVDGQDASVLREDEDVLDAFERCRNRQRFAPNQFNRAAVNRQLREVEHADQSASDVG